MLNLDAIKTPFFDSLCVELGPDVVFERYFDENLDVREDAPEELREEIRLLRLPDDRDPALQGVIFR